MKNSSPVMDARFGPFFGRVDKDAAIAYALATNDPNPLYLEGLAVPPLYSVSLILPAYLRAHNAVIESDLVQGSRFVVHGEHEIVFHRPLVPGDDLVWNAHVYGAMQTQAGVLVTQHIVVDDLSGSTVLEHFMSGLFIGGAIDHDLGRSLPDHAFPAAARLRPLRRDRFEISADQTFRYAGASTDHAAVHVDDVAAQAAGFPGKFLQGLCSLAMCSAAVVNSAGGDPVRLRRLAARFAAPVFPRRELLVELYEAGESEDGTQTVVFEARSGDDMCIKHGLAELRSADS